MRDIRYTKGVVDVSYHKTFEQLISAFPEYEVWVRYENFDRWLSVGVVNRSTGVAAIAGLLQHRRNRTELLNQDELARIRAHLQSLSEEDLLL